MKSYCAGIEEFASLLNDFKNKGAIDVDKLHLVDAITESIEEDQVNILNSAYLTLEQQMSLFGATRSLRNVIKTMKERLVTAAKRHENPTAAELSLQMIDHLLNVSVSLDRFKDDNKMEIAKINEFSRLLHKKAKLLGFSRSTKDQFIEAGITTDEVKAFTETLNSNIDTEIEIADESMLEGVDRDIRTD